MRSFSFFVWHNFLDWRGFFFGGGGSFKACLAKPLSGAALLWALPSTALQVDFQLEEGEEDLSTVRNIAWEFQQLLCVCVPLNGLKTLKPLYMEEQTLGPVL